MFANNARYASLFAIKLEELLVNIPPKTSYQTLQTTKLNFEKTVRVTSFPKTTIVIRFNLLQVCSFVPFVFVGFCFTQFGDISHILNFDLFVTQLL